MENRESGIWRMWERFRILNVTNLKVIENPKSPSCNNVFGVNLILKIEISLDNTLFPASSFCLFVFYLFFNWRKMALQKFVVFCQTSAWIRHRYIYIPSLLNLPPCSFRNMIGVSKREKPLVLKHVKIMNNPENISNISADVRLFPISNHHFSS